MAGDVSWTPPMKTPGSKRWSYESGIEGWEKNGEKWSETGKFMLG
jgi:hypothetical protein